jgi:hypothetical protein
MTPKVRQSIYRLGTAVSALLGLALIWGGISQGTADHINTVLAGLVALLGGIPPAIAGKTVKEQTKSGAFDSVPPAEQAITAIQATIEQAITAQADVQRVTDAVTQALQSTPIGPVVSAAEDVVERVIRASTR